MNNTDSFFTEENTKTFANQLMAMWSKDIAKNWFWLGYQALEKAGLTYYETNQEEALVSERIVLLCIFYYEFCHISAFHESDNFRYLGEETIQSIKQDLSNNADDVLDEVRNALINYFGSEEQVIAELWINCLEGSSNRFIPLEEKSKLLNELNFTNPYDPNQSRARTWFVGWNKGLGDFEGISI